MANAPQQQQSQQEKAEIKLGEEQTSRAQNQSKPLLLDHQKKMNRDDASRLGGMATADVAQAAGMDRTGQQLASGQGGGFGSTGYGAQLSQATSNAGNVALGRQDGLKSGYNELGNKKNINAVASLKSGAAAASGIAAAEANASMIRQNAMLDAATSVAASKALGMKDAYDTANYNLKRGIKKAGYAGPFESDAIKSLRETRNNVPGKNFFDKYWSND